MLLESKPKRKTSLTQNAKRHANYELRITNYELRIKKALHQKSDILSSFGAEQTRRKPAHQQGHINFRLSIAGLRLVIL
jgi:hypothetical protein